MAASKYQRMCVWVNGRQLPQKVTKYTFNHATKGEATEFRPVRGVFVDYDGCEYSQDQLEDMAQRNGWQMRIIYG